MALFVAVLMDLTNKMEHVLHELLNSGNVLQKLQLSVDHSATELEEKAWLGMGLILISNGLRNKRPLSLNYRADDLLPPN